MFEINYGPCFGPGTRHEYLDRVLFNRVVAAEVLGIADELEITRLVLHPRTVQVYVGKVQRYYSRRAFLDAFIRLRKQRAAGLRVWCSEPGVFIVHNPENEHSHYVVQQGYDLACDCADSEAQRNAEIPEFRGMTFCKHKAAVLRHLNFSTLRDFVSSVSKPVAA